jgi:hypothetical protein
MNLTLGSEEALTEQTLSQIVDRVKAELTKGKDQELQLERASLAHSEKERLRLLHKTETIRKRAYDVTETIGKIAGWLTTGIFILVLLGSALLAAFWAQSITPTSWLLNFGVVVLVIVGILWSIASGFSNVTLDGLAKAIQRLCQRRLYSALLSWLNLGPPES